MKNNATLRRANKILSEAIEADKMCNWCWWILLRGTKRTQDECTCGRRLGYVRPTWCCEKGDGCCDGCEHTEREKLIKERRYGKRKA